MVFKDPLVYCGSGTETIFLSLLLHKKKILWSTAEAVLRLVMFFIFIKKNLRSSGLLRKRY